MASRNTAARLADALAILQETLARATQGAGSLATMHGQTSDQIGGMLEAQRTGARQDEELEMARRRLELLEQSARQKTLEFERGEAERVEGQRQEREAMGIVGDETPVVTGRTQPEQRRVLQDPKLTTRHLAGLPLEPTQQRQVGLPIVDQPSQNITRPRTFMDKFAEARKRGVPPDTFGKVLGLMPKPQLVQSSPNQALDVFQGGELTNLRPAQPKPKELTHTDILWKAAGGDPQRYLEIQKELRKSGATQLNMGSPTERKSEVEGRTQLAMINRIRQSIRENPGLIGGALGYKGRRQNILEHLDKADPAFPQLRADIARLKASVIHELAGAAIGPEEAKAYLASVPDVTQSSQQFTANLNATEINLQNLRRYRQELLRSGFAPGDPNAPPPPKPVSAEEQTPPGFTPLD